MHQNSPFWERKPKKIGERAQPDLFNPDLFVSGEGDTLCWQVNDHMNIFLN